MPIQLIAPPHTPFNAQGELNLEIVDQQAHYFAATGVAGVFVCGSTGEGESLRVDERMRLAERWVDVSGQEDLDVIVQVGGNCQREAARLAAHAAEIGADGISAHAPGYFKPAAVQDLVDFLASIAAAADDLPFYYYDIPSMTGVSLPAIDLLRHGTEQIPNLAGVKYSHMDLVQLQQCLRLDDGSFDILFGCDEALLAAYALGVSAAIGSTYNFMAPLYHRMIEAYESADAQTARQLQAKSVDVVRVLKRHGFLAASKFLMSLLGVDCGPVRPPLRNLTKEQKNELQQDLEQMGVSAKSMAGDREIFAG